MVCRGWLPLFACRPEHISKRTKRLQCLLGCFLWNLNYLVAQLDNLSSP